MAIASVLPILFFAGSPPLPNSPFVKPSLSKVCRPRHLLSSSNADNLEAFSRWRRQWSSPMLDSDHPAIAALNPTTFQTRAPQLSTKLEVESCGLHRLLLQWDSAQLGMGEELIPVGSMEFHPFSPCKQISGLEEVLSVKCAELKNIDILQPFRGHRGTTMLMENMLRVVGEAESQYVVLRHLDRGSGKLVKYYERFGFEDARSALPATDEVQQHLDQDHMIAPVDTLLWNTVKLASSSEQPATAPAAVEAKAEERRVTVRPSSQKKKRMVVVRQAELHPLPY